MRGMTVTFVWTTNASNKLRGCITPLARMVAILNHLNHTTCLFQCRRLQTRRRQNNVVVVAGTTRTILTFVIVLEPKIRHPGVKVSVTACTIILIGLLTETRRIATALRKCLAVKMRNIGVGANLNDMHVWTINASHQQAVLQLMNVRIFALGPVPTQPFCEMLNQSHSSDDFLIATLWI